MWYVAQYINVYILIDKNQIIIIYHYKDQASKKKTCFTFSILKYT